MSNMYEIPTTDPAAQPYGAPPAAMPAPPSAGDFAHLPPPGFPPLPDGMTHADIVHSPIPETAPPGMPGYNPAPEQPMGMPMPPQAPPMPQQAPQIPQQAPQMPPGLAQPAPAPAHPVAAPPAAPATESLDDESARAARRNADPDLLQCLQDVLLQGASDLHVSVGTPPLLRVDGTLRPAPGQGYWDRERTRNALFSILNPKQRATFDEKLELDFAFTLSANARFRVNFYQQRGAIGGAFRLIPTEIKQLDQLGVPAQIGEFAKLPRGLVLVTGPTGSGKSTTLAALIDLVNQTRADHIVTVEDPIEFIHTNKKSLVNQREVGADTHSFANALKHVLRQDPDVILIGELRDLETISVALTAAETGHLVFATLHTQSAGSTIDRIIDVFPPHQQDQVRTQLASTLQGVVCQTLVKRTGGAGRAVATEIMVTTPAIANLVREGKTYQVRSALQSGGSHGMHTMDQHLAELVNSGVTSYGAALEKAQDLEDFKRLVRREVSEPMGMGRTS